MREHNYFPNCTDCGAGNGNHKMSCSCFKQSKTARAEQCPTVHTGEVIKCPAQSVVEESCICKPGWGHRSWHILDAPPAASTVTPEITFSTGAPPGVADAFAHSCYVTAPSEPGSAEQWGNYLDALSKSYPEQASLVVAVAKEGYSLGRAQLQERAQEILHLDNARQTLVAQLQEREREIEMLKIAVRILQS